MISRHLQVGEGFLPQTGGQGLLIGFPQGGEEGAEGGVRGGGEKLGQVAEFLGRHGGLEGEMGVCYILIHQVEDKWVRCRTSVSRPDHEMQGVVYPSQLQEFTTRDLLLARSACQLLCGVMIIRTPIRFLLLQCWEFLPHLQHSERNLLT